MLDEGLQQRQCLSHVVREERLWVDHRVARSDQPGEVEADVEGGGVEHAGEPLEISDLHLVKRRLLWDRVAVS